MSAQFTPVSGNPAVGDGLALPDLASVTDYTICCFFKQTGFGGALSSIPIPYIKALTSFNDSATGNYCFYFSDFGDAGNHGVAEFGIANDDHVNVAVPSVSLATLHSFIIVRSVATTTFYIDNVSVHSASSGTATITAKNIRIGCHFASGSNQYFEWAQIGHWAFWKRAWTSGERATYNGGRDVITQSSPDIFTTLAISRTSIAYYLPLVATLLETVVGATVTTIGAPTVLVPASQVDYAVVVPGGGDMLQVGLKTLALGTPDHLVSYNGGLTITPSGGSPQSLSPQCATALTFLWAPLDPVGNWESIQDDTAAVKVGTWTTTAGFDNGLYGWHNSGDSGRFARSYGNQHALSSTSSATATWTFTSVPPGKYVVLAIYQADTGRTATATYTVKDGATTVGTFTVDQRSSMRFDDIAPQNTTAANGRRVMILGTDPKLTAPLYTANLVTITTGSSVTVQVVNTAGSGVLTANLMGLRRVIQPIAAGAVLNAPTGWCTTAAGDATAVTNFAVGTTTIDAFMPFDAAAARTLWRGYNVSVPSYQTPDLFYADRMRSAFKWQGGATVNANGDMTANSGTATRIFLYEPQQRGFDGYPLVMMKETGTWTIKYTIVSGTPVVVIAKEQDHGEVIGTHSTATLVSGKMVRTVSIDTRGTIHPGVASLRVEVTGGAANVEVYGPEVPSGWTSKFHPALISWLQNRGFTTIRMDPNGLNNNSEVEWVDMPADGTSSTLWVRPSRTFSVTSVGPVNRADLVPWYGAMNQRCAVLITTSAAHGIRTGDTPMIWGLSADGTGWGITTTLGTSTASILRQNPAFAIRVDATNFIWLGFGPNSGEVDVTNAAQCITLTTSHSVTGSVTVENGIGIPYADMLRLVNECNVGSYYFNAPVSASDDFATQMGILAATTLDSTKKLRVAVSNETWNPGFQGTVTSTIWEFHAQYLYNTTGGTQGADVGAALGRAWLAYRTNQIANLIKAEFTSRGRPATDVIVAIECQLGFTLPASQSLDFASSIGILFQELNPATYRGIVTDPGAYPTFGMGYNTDIQSGLAALSDASVPSLVWINQRYGVMAGQIGAHRAALTAHGYGSEVKIGTYEGGQDYLNLWSIERSARTFRHPGMYREELSITQYLQSVGLAGECEYTLHYPNGPEAGAQWLTYRTAFEDAGTGATSENQNPQDLRSGETTATFGPGAFSQTGGAHRTWVSAPSTGVTVTLTATTGPATLAASVLAGTGGAVRHIPRNRPAGASPTPIAVTTPGASSGARSTVVSGWPATWTTFPMILTASRAGALLGNLEAIAQSSGTLTISGVIDGYTDFALVAGDVLECRPSALAITEIHAELDALETITEVNVTGAITLTVTALGKMHVCSGTTANYTVVLPTAVGNAGRSIRFRMASGLTKMVTLDGNGAETIDGGSTRMMHDGETATLYSDGSNWFKVAGRSVPSSCSIRLANHASPSTAQVITAAVDTKILLNTVDSDSTGQMANVANNRAVCLRTGKHTVNAQAFFFNLSVNRAILSIKLFVNGSDIADFNFSALATAYASVPWVGDINLVAGDVVELYVYVGGTTTENLYGDTTGGASYLTIKEAAPW